jgi:hypothetical protein
MYQKIYIVSPANFVTGGPETLHQVCKVINEKKLSKAYIVYVDPTNFLLAFTPTPKKLQHYKDPVSTIIEDYHDNLLIVPEGWTSFLKKYRNIQKAVVWLSLSFFTPYKSVIDRIVPYSRIAKIVKPLFPILLTFKHPHYLFHQRMTYKDLRKIKHSYNCLSTKNFFEKNHINSENYLCGPISDDYFNRSKSLNQSKKQNVICYNPLKGYSFTKKIINSFKRTYGDKYLFIPITKMSNQEVVDVLSKAKLYIDFGYFPGHERIPRQAVLLYCNVITSTLGAAKYNDVCIPETYKFDVNNRNITSIVSTMGELCDNYQEHVAEFSKYREFCYWQRDNFENEVIAFLSDVPFKCKSD